MLRDPTVERTADRARVRAAAFEASNLEGVVVDEGVIERLRIEVTDEGDVAVG